MVKVRAKAPTRVDIAGGTIDLWPIHNVLQERATVNVAISLHAEATVEISSKKEILFESQDQHLTDQGVFEKISKSDRLKLFSLLVGSMWSDNLPGFTLTTNAKSPAGAGLGGSSCLAVTILSALNRARQAVDSSFKPYDEYEIVRMAQDVESLVIWAPTGVQDYWGAMRGGVNILTYPFGRVSVETLSHANWSKEGLSLVCCYSGKSRASAINNWEIFKRVFDGDKALLSKLSDIGRLSSECAKSVKQGRWRDAVALSKDEWNIRLSLWPNIETEETKKIDSAAQKAGAMFTRVCGAGGGGVMAVVCESHREAEVSKAMTEVGGQVMAVELGGAGVQVEVLH